MTDLGLGAILASGTTVARTLRERWADVVNVKDFGAVGDNSTNDTAAIQAAFDYAFTTSGTPHGIANAHLNKPLFIPNGKYIVRDPITVNNLYGGYIFGCGGGSEISLIGFTSNPYPAGSAALKINGMINSRIERVGLGSGGAVYNLSPGPGQDVQGQTCLWLDYDGTSWSSEVGTLGLHDNVISEVALGQSTYGLKLAPSGYDGTNNWFYAVYGNNQCIMMHVIGTDAKHNKVVFSGASDAVNFPQIGAGSARGIYIEGGGISQVIGGSNAGNHIDQWDIKSDTTEPMLIMGMRSENPSNFDLAGSAIIRGVQLGSGDDPGGTDIYLKTHSPSKYILEATSTAYGRITGDGTIYLRGFSTTTTTYPNVLTGFTGTIAQQTGCWINFS